MNDPWIGRSEGMRCQTCTCFCPKGDKADEKKGEFGRCRAHAPTMRGFPVVWGMELVR
jgi:Pyruvate/2-oxoacid:ferredoxin oxidoreductase delta subunit